MKTIAQRASLSMALLCAPALQAQTADPEQQLRTFATCAGRLSAVMEHQWLFDGPASDITKAQRTTVLELVEAIMPPERGAEVLQWRISAKLAQSALLTRATFNEDEEDATWAREQAEQFARECTGLLLS